MTKSPSAQNSVARSRVHAPPHIYSIPSHRAFADSLVRGLYEPTLGLVDRDGLGLARGVLLLPNNRSRRAVEAAFVRASGAGCLLPRMVTIGDIDLDDMGVDPDLADDIFAETDIEGEADELLTYRDNDGDIAQSFDGVLADSAPLPMAIDSFQRQMILARLISEYYQKTAQSLSGRMAFRLAKDLGRVIDQLYYEDIAPAEIMNIDSEDCAQHWQLSQALLTLLIHEWLPQLERLGKIDVAKRRVEICNRLAQHWSTSPPPHFVVAAGINVTAPAMLRLLRTIADLPQGMVVLSGLDMMISDSEWEVLGTTTHSKHASERGDERVAQEQGEERKSYPALETHPQYHLKYMLEKMHIGRGEVQTWIGDSPYDSSPSRDSMISALFAPACLHEQGKAPAVAEASEQSQSESQSHSHSQAQAQAQTESESESQTASQPQIITTAEFFNEAEEAQAIALLMRYSLESKGQTAALVTPDRRLAARVATALKRWNITIDDSAGKPISQTPPGVLLCLLADFAVRGSLSTLIAILSHPLVLPEKFHPARGKRGKQSTLEARESERSKRRQLWLDKVRSLDLLLREPGIASGLAGVSEYLTRLSRASTQKTPRKTQGEGDAKDSDSAKHDSHLDIRASQAQALLAWWNEWCPDLADRLQIFAKFHNIDPTDTAKPSETDDSDVTESNESSGSREPSESFENLLSNLCAAAESLSNRTLWAHESGRALGNVLKQCLDNASHAPPAIAIGEFPAILSDILTDVAVPPAAYRAHPRLFIWGQIEARLQRADVMILGGLNEGVWPPKRVPDPWLAAGIRRRLGLPAPDYQQGLAAHEFAQMLAAPRVIVTRAERQDGDSAVPSRFWLRLQAMQIANGKETIDGQPIEELVHHFDRPTTLPQPTAKPAPCPPTEARPRRVSVTALEGLGKEPFGFYAREILRFYRLRQIGAPTDAMWLGQRVHKLLEDWVREGRKRAPQELVDRLERDPSLDSISRAFWLPRIEPSLLWVAAQIESQAREGRAPLAVESKAEWTDSELTISGKADRIDRCSDGSLAIVDYKTGSVPSAKDIDEARALQLGLLAILVEVGGFAEIPAAEVTALEYWQLKPDRKSNRDGKIAEPKSPTQAIANAHERLATLRAEYLFGSAPFSPSDDHKALRNSDYIWLMRHGEWLGRGRREQREQREQRKAEAMQ